MSKRMVTYSVTDDDKIASIDGHALGSGDGNKSISRRMITYKVDESGKIASIDGHELAGGGDYEIKPLEVTANGVYDVVGEAYKPVRVNVPQTAQSGTLKAVLDAGKSTQYLFENYQGTNIDGLISYNDTSNVTNMYDMFYNCQNLTSIPQLNTSNVTNMYGMFHNCQNLTSIPQFDTSNVENMNDMFYGCRKLKEIHMTGMKVSFDISVSTKFTREALVEILNNIATVTSTKKLTMGATNLAKLTDEDKAIATNKGWQLA